MTVAWQKLGRVWGPDGTLPWARTHAFCPTALTSRDGQTIRVFSSCLDAELLGRLGWVDVDAEHPDRVLGASPRPAFDVGRPGTFDEHGVNPMSIVRLDDGRLRLYYNGYQRGVGVRYLLFTGVAESDDEGETFRRLSEAPVLDRSDEGLFVRSSASVERDGDGWRMWYVAGSAWEGAGDDARPSYALRHQRSADGLRWGPDGTLCLAPEPGELGFARACVRPAPEGLRMWYSVRAPDGRYRLGYATSGDGVAWDRQDDRSGLARGAPGEWDHEMLGLTSLVDAGGRLVLFYNGNGYGREGFGVAVGEDPGP